MAAQRVEHLAEGVTLYLGDCRELISAVDVDALITSPPYNCGKDYGTASDSLPIEQYQALLRDSVFGGNAVRRCINTGVYIGSRKNRMLARDIVLGCTGQRIVDEIIWDKGPANGAAWGNYPTSPRIRAQHETIYVFGENPIAGDSGVSWQEWSVLTNSIWRISANVDLSVHPAQMPVELALRLVKLYSPSNGVVCDPFMGSGTTGVAAVKLGRKFRGIEIEPRFFDIACSRISEALKQPDFFVERFAPLKQEAMEL